MRRTLLGLLACPMCRGSLTLHVQREQEGSIVSGTLACAACRQDYPIEQDIPNLLPPAMRATPSGSSAADG
jgi:uncharacterized protein YbaR (Trm112 family)